MLKALSFPTPRSNPETDIVPMLVAGKWIKASGQTEPVYNPADGTVIGRVPMCTAEEVDAAVQAASAAFPGWRKTPVVERVQCLFRFKNLLEQNREELARLVTEENGKTIAEARGEVRRGIEVVDFACGMPTLMMGETLDQIADRIDSRSVHVPLGVVAGICPFNFPAMIPLWMIPIAIAAGNTFVLKPSERTPFTGVRIAELLMDSDLPRGVINVVHGARETVTALLEHRGIRAISFVGSAPVAKYIYETAAKNGKRVQALAGAKNHLLVMPDADLRLTVDAVLSSAFGSSGQRCLAGSVVVAVGEIGDKFVQELRTAAASLRIGPGEMEDSAMGPLIRSEARERVKAYIAKGVAEGAELVLDGCGAGSKGSERGYFLGPVIFDRVQPDMSIAIDEIFGPILSVIRTDDIDHALAIVNHSGFGNAASIFTRNGEAARRFRTEVEAGMVGINIGVAAPMAFFPFAGWKGSFFGDLHATGKDAVKFYTETRVVTERW